MYDNFKNIENAPINTFIHHLCENETLRQLKVKDVRYLLPEIRHFKKYGELCAVNCAVNCHYCYKCADKIEKIYQKKKEAIKRRTIPVCIIK